MRPYVEKSPLGFGDFDRILERAARVLAARDLAGFEADFVRSTVEHDIGLILAQLDRLRAHRAEARERLSRVECDLGTELVQMDAARWWYLDSREERWRDRQRLKARLASAESERTRTEAKFEQELRSLEDRLLVLVHRHGAVGGAETG